MTRTTSSGTDAGGGAAPAGTSAGTEAVEDLDQALEQMRLSEAEPGAEPGDDPGGASESRGDPEPDSRAAGKAGETAADKSGDKDGDKPPLTPDELNKRWRDTRAALRQERDARQAGEAANRELRSELDALKAQLAALTGGKARPQAAPDLSDPSRIEIPDPDQDPEGAFRAAIALAKAMQRQQRETDEESVLADRQQAALRTLVDQFRAAEAEYIQATPDYNDAVTYMREKRLAELQLFGLPEQQARQAFQREILQLVAAAMRSDMHPAHVIYEMAKHRGYAGPKPAGSDPKQAEQDMKQRAEAAKLSRSMGGGGGKAAKAEATFEALNAIENGDEFDRAFAELARAEGVHL